MLFNVRDAFFSLPAEVADHVRQVFLYESVNIMSYYLDIFIILRCAVEFVVMSVGSEV